MPYAGLSKVINLVYCMSCMLALSSAQHRIRSQSAASACAPRWAGTVWPLWLTPEACDAVPHCTSAWRHSAFCRRTGQPPCTSLSSQQQAPWCSVCCRFCILACIFGGAQRKLAASQCLVQILSSLQKHLHVQYRQVSLSHLHKKHNFITFSECMAQTPTVKSNQTDRQIDSRIIS